MTGIRLACWPASSSHDYLRSLYRALEAHDVHLAIDGVQFEDAVLRERREDFDALHIHFAEHLWGAGQAPATSRVRGIAGLIRFLASARRLRIPVVWTAHNLRPHERGDFIDTVGLWRVARTSNLAICHDRRTFFRLSQWPYRSPTTTVMLARHGNFDIVWPPQPDAAAARERLGVAPDDRLLLCFGLMRPYKGFDLAIEATKELRQPYRLAIAGPVADEAHLHELLALAGDHPRVSILPRWLSDEELVQWLAASDCVLFPYREITGSGALLGAVTAHRGVVASDLPFFHETLSLSPGSGVLCKPGDARSLEAAIRRFFEVPASDRRKAVARLSALHDWRTIVKPVADWLHANVPWGG